MTGRSLCITEKVATPFGALYLHIKLDAHGRPCGGSISTPGKEPESQVHRLVEALSAGLDAALAAVGEAGQI